MSKHTRINSPDIDGYFDPSVIYRQRLMAELIYRNGKETALLTFVFYTDKKIRIPKTAAPATKHNDYYRYVVSLTAEETHNVVRFGFVKGHNVDFFKESLDIIANWHEGITDLPFKTDDFSPAHIKYAKPKDTPKTPDPKLYRHNGIRRRPKP